MRNLFFSFAFLLLVNHANALDIKGQKVDLPVNCEKIRQLETRPGTFVDSCSAGRSSWMQQVSFGSSKVMMSFYQSKSGILSSIVVNFNEPSEFQETIDALSLKFGEPISFEQSTVQNRVGAKFEQKEAVWRDGAEEIRLSLHGFRLGKPMLVYHGAQWIQDIKEERLNKSRKGAENL